MKIQESDITRYAKLPIQEQAEKFLCSILSYTQGSHEVAGYGKNIYREYINKDNYKNSIDRILSYSGKGDIYLLANPGKEDAVRKNSPSNENNIEARKFLLIDFDTAQKPSTKKEQKECFDAALHLINELQLPSEQIGINASGNGIVLYIACENLETKFVKQYLEKIKEFLKYQNCIIDLQVCNLRRGIKIPGTLANKGEENKEEGRIHREAKLLWIPETFVPRSKKDILRDIAFLEYWKDNDAINLSDKDFDALKEINGKRYDEKLKNLGFVVEEKDNSLAQEYRQPPPLSSGKRLGEGSGGCPNCGKSWGKCLAGIFNEHKWFGCWSLEDFDNLGTKGKDYLEYDTDMGLTAVWWKDGHKFSGKRNDDNFSMESFKSKREVENIEPDNLEVPCSDLTPFPIEAFPTPIKEYVLEVQKAGNFPHDMVGAAALGIVSNSLAKNFKVLKSETHPSHGNLAVFIAADQGIGKSPIMKLLKSSIDRKKQELDDDYYKASQKYKTDRKIWDVKVKKQQNQIDKVNDTDAIRYKNENSFKALLGEEPQEPTKKDLYVTDYTSEAFGAALQQNDETLAVINPEARKTLSNLKGRYTKEGDDDLDSFCCSSDGDTCIVKRVTREDVSLKEPIVSYTLMMQSGIMREWFNNKNVIESGSGARCLPVWISSNFFAENNNIDNIDCSKKNAYDSIIYDLLSCNEQTVFAINDEVREALNREVSAIKLQGFNEKQKYNRNEIWIGFLFKSEQTLLKLLTVLKAIDWIIDKQNEHEINNIITMYHFERAWKIYLFFRNQLQNILEVQTDNSIPKNAIDILNWLWSKKDDFFAENENGIKITSSNLIHNFKTKYKSKKDTLELFSYLIDSNWLVQKGTSPRQYYVLLKSNFERLEKLVSQNNGMNHIDISQTNNFKHEKKIEPSAKQISKQMNEDFDKDIMAKAEDEEVLLAPKKNALDDLLESSVEIKEEQEKPIVVPAGPAIAGQPIAVETPKEQRENEKEPMRQETSLDKLTDNIFGDEPKETQVVNLWDEIPKTWVKTKEEIEWEKAREVELDNYEMFPDNCKVA